MTFCFWHDIWCGNQALSELFPELFSIIVDKDAYVHYYLGISNEEGTHS